MPSPRDRRLQTDFEKVKKLAVESAGKLRIMKITGSPPMSYCIEYHCPGLEKNKQDQIIIRDVHQVEINLSVNYPLEKPTARMLTPIFNPHVFITNAVCLGNVWNAAETLDQLILRIGALLQLDPKVLDSKSAANRDASNWVDQNRSKIPLGNVSFRGGTDSNRRIDWA